MISAPEGDGCELYVYYRVPVEHTEAAGLEVARAQQALTGRWPGLEARLLQRSEASSTTWMEVYRHPRGLDAALLHDVRSAMALLPGARSGPRHEECFVPHRHAG